MGCEPLSASALGSTAQKDYCALGWDRMHHFAFAITSGARTPEEDNMSDSERDRLDGRRALVTGGSKGSGKAVAERLRELGADVFVTARSMPDGYEFPDRFIEADTSTVAGSDRVA